MRAAWVLPTLLALAMPAMAEEPVPDLGTVIVRLRADGVAPQDSASNITKLGGTWRSTTEAGLDADASVFLTPHLAVGLGAATTRHRFRLDGTQFGTVPVGTARLIVPSVTLQWHFTPIDRFRPYLGLGPAAAVLVSPTPAGTLVDDLYFKSRVGAVFQAGVDVALGGPFVLNADLKQMLVRTTAFSPHPGRTPVKANVKLNPTIFGVGVGYRF